MFSFISSLSSSAYLYIIATLLSMTVLFGGLLYWQIGKTSEAESALVVAINANTDLQKSLNLKDLSCKIDDSISTERTEEKQASDTVKDKEIASIDELPVKIKAPLVAIPTNQASVQALSNENNTVDIDNELPADLVRLLSQSYNRAKERTGDDSRQSSSPSL